MYRQILVHPSDTPFQRILFRFGPESQVEDCELLTVTFGINCAPFLAIRTLEKLADDHRDIFSLAAQIVLTEFYVDDVLSGNHDLVTAQKAQQELIALLGSAGFPLRKWTSNTPALLDYLPTKHLLSDNFLVIDKESTKTLDVRWNAKEDVFYFSTTCIPLSSVPSKREVFSQIAQLFDPAGWLAPIIITAKALIQSIWVEKTEWDEAIQGKSSENPADLATRGTSPRELRISDLWWTGPPWLRQPENQWPRNLPAIKASDELETKVVSNYAAVNTSEDILERFSSLPRALRVLTQVFRFYFRARTNQSSIFSKVFAQAISQKEMNFIKVRLISLSQIAYYPREVESLSHNKLISTKSSILSLNPILDANRLLRVNGGLTNAILTVHERHPIILPYGSRFTRLFDQFIHELSLHGGNALMLQLKRQMFWVPKVKNLIKFCIQRCKVCCIHKQKLTSQLMAALPTERVTFSPPFSHTGIDFAGPFEIKSSRTRGCRVTKGYACLFVCFSTKAIHLEGASDLSSQVFLAAFARFVARRGLPQAVFTDHGTNFLGADAILCKEFKKFLELVSVDVRSKNGFQGLEWNFIPPGAPHIKSFKTHLRKLGKTSRFTFEEFATLLARIEASGQSGRPVRVNTRSFFAW